MLGCLESGWSVQVGIAPGICLIAHGGFTNCFMFAGAATGVSFYPF